MDLYSNLFHALLAAQQTVTLVQNCKIAYIYIRTINLSIEYEGLACLNLVQGVAVPDQLPASA